MDWLNRWYHSLPGPSLRCALGIHDWTPRYQDPERRHCTRCGRDHP